MLSVLIPTYNWNVVPLVKELYLQLVKAKIPFEIIVLEDASNSELNLLNQQINSLTNCYFEVLKKNIGRSAIRNLLAKKANYKWLLFLDADVMPTLQDFVNKYIGETEKNLHQVFLGGVAYKQDQNFNKIRWKLGRKGEEQYANTRSKNPFNYFFTANFLIEKEIFNSVRFNENLTNYGYEDLLFAKELAKQKIALKHLDNQVLHLGIDENSVFLDKTKKALENLTFLIKRGEIYREDTKISNVFYKLKPLGITGFLSLFVEKLEEKTIQKSSVLYYNLFRLAYLHKVFKNFK